MTPTQAGIRRLIRVLHPQPECDALCNELARIYLELGLRAQIVTPHPDSCPDSCPPHPDSCPGERV